MRVTPEILEAEWQRSSGDRWLPQFLGRWFPSNELAVYMDPQLFERILDAFPNAGKDCRRDPLIRARIWSIVCSE